MPRAIRASDAAAWAATAAASIGPMVVTSFVQELQRNGPEDGARNTPHAADDEHSEIPDRVYEGELVDARERVVVDKERTCDAGVEAADEEGLEFVDPEIDPHHFGGEVVVADRNVCPARSCSRDIDRPVRGKGAHGHDEVIVTRL